jgi:hypothetical protein
LYRITQGIVQVIFLAFEIKTAHVPRKVFFFILGVKEHDQRVVDGHFSTEFQDWFSICFLFMFRVIVKEVEQELEAWVTREYFTFA